MTQPSPSGKNDKPARPQPPPPLDVVDGIADRSSTPRKWKYVLLAILFLSWVAVLIYFAAAGNL